MDYCTNNGSDQEIATRYNISIKELHKRAQKYDWKKVKPERSYAAYHLLVYHSLDVAAVGEALLDRHPVLLQRLAMIMKISEEQARVWMVFLLSIHDIGKFGESFQQLREDLRLLFWPNISIRCTNYNVRHDSLGLMLWLQNFKKKFLQSSSEVNSYFIEYVISEWLAAVFGHHGWPPSNEEMLKKHFQDIDQIAAFEFLQECRELLQPNFQKMAKLAENKDWRTIQKNASWLIAGVAVLCDWLGSDAKFFKFQTKLITLEDYWNNYAIPSAQRAIQASGILPSVGSSQQCLTDLFTNIESATPLQQACADIDLFTEPQLFILEDVTGAGKTEAALMLVHRLMSADLAQGLYIGLPTMATANAMYDRMANVYERLYDVDEKPNLILSHSARHLSERFQQSLLSESQSNQNYKEEENITVQCNRWLADNRKKALLADVGIGTIDQALLGVMPARHQSLRILGLANKVLVLDEVHAYDAYTNEPLKKLIEFHSAFGGSVILLTATLTKKQRKQFINAFNSSGEKIIESSKYPLLTHVCSSGYLNELALDTRNEVKRTVKVSFVHSDTDVIESILAAVDRGQCVCWIRNTVADARDAYKLLSDIDRIEKNRLHLFHSRFALFDRLTIEQEMLRLFGKNSKPKERTGCVLIATQVVEQSLDLDFDAMVSDLAPIDLLIQRAGRLQRHTRENRVAPELVVYSPKIINDPQSDWYQVAFPKAQYVYPDTLILWRTAKILEKKRGWKMPDDARELLETVYCDNGEIPEGLSDSVLEMEGKVMSERDSGAFSSLRLETGYGDTQRWDEDVRVATRLGDETQTIYLARWQDGKLRPWADAGRYLWDLSSLRVNYKQLSRLAVQEDTLEVAIAELKENESLFNEHSFILPLTHTNEHWMCMGCDEYSNSVKVKYSDKLGLKLEGQL